MKELIKKVVKIQSELKAPKGQYNNFGKYAYRSCEDILEALKPHLAQEGLVQTISDEVVMVGERIYVKATVTVTDGSSSIEGSGFAREAEDKKGMDSSQLTGSTSSYARKYALNGMWNIDDTKDADATNTHGKEPIVAKSGIPKSNTRKPQSKANPTVSKEAAKVVSKAKQSNGKVKIDNVASDAFKRAKMSVIEGIRTVDFILENSQFSNPELKKEFLRQVGQNHE